MRKRSLWVALLFLTLLLQACNGGSALQGNGKLQVLATTSIVGDVARQVGGDLIEVKVLLPLGSDPHTFEPRPQDAAALAEAQIIFANGAGLEEFLQPLIESTAGTGKLVEVSRGITLLAFSGEADHTGGDPHTWMDPNNLLVWVDNITAALTSEDPQHADTYQSNAEAYKAELMALDAWIRSRWRRLRLIGASWSQIMRCLAILPTNTVLHSWERSQPLSVPMLRLPRGKSQPWKIPSALPASRPCW